MLEIYNKQERLYNPVYDGIGGWLKQLSKKIPTVIGRTVMHGTSSHQCQYDKWTKNCATLMQPFQWGMYSILQLMSNHICSLRWLQHDRIGLSFISVLKCDVVVDVDGVCVYVCSTYTFNLVVSAEHCCQHPISHDWENWSISQNVNYLPVLFRGKNCLTSFKISSFII